MKRLVSAALAACLLLGCAACAKKTEEPTTVEPDTGAEYNGPSLDEMSPPSLSTEAPVTLPSTWRAVDKSEFRRIKSEDSMAPQYEAKTVYRSGSTEYYIMEGGAVYVLLAGEEEDAYYSAYYGPEGGLLFLGDADKSWFFKEDGSFDYMTYTYTAPGGAEVVTFYEGENSRFAVYAGNTYYDGDLNELTGPEQVQLVTRVAAAFSMMGGMDAM